MQDIILEAVKLIVPFIVVVFSAIVGGLIALFVFIVKGYFNNKKKLELIEQSIKHFEDRIVKGLNGIGTRINGVDNKIETDITKLKNEVETDITKLYSEIEKEVKNLYEKIELRIDSIDVRTHEVYKNEPDLKKMSDSVNDLNKELKEKLEEIKVQFSLIKEIYVQWLNKDK